MSTFQPSAAELLNTEDLFTSLIRQGRQIVKEESSVSKSIREMQEAQSARNLAATQRALDRLAWRPTTCIALINRAHCDGCGTETDTFAGFGISMRRRSDSAERIVMSTSPDEGYPAEVRYTITHTAFCIECINLKGFSYEKESPGGNPRQPVPTSRDSSPAQTCRCRYGLWGSKVWRTDSDCE